MAMGKYEAQRTGVIISVLELLNIVKNMPFLRETPM
jgi:hypothetical protein